MAEEDIWILRRTEGRMTAATQKSWSDPALLARPCRVCSCKRHVSSRAGDDLHPDLPAHADFQLRWTWDLTTWADVFSKPHYWTILGHTLFMAFACVAIA